MLRYVCVFLIIVMIFSSCGNAYTQSVSADVLLQEVMIRFDINDGYLYSRDTMAEYPLTDAMLERIFFGTSLDDLCYAESMAVYFSGRFCDHEIIVIELFDMSHRKAVASLLTKRADLKENALVYMRGNYVFLICTDRNEEILAAFREKIG